MTSTRLLINEAEIGTGLALSLDRGADGGRYKGRRAAAFLPDITTRLKRISHGLADRVLYGFDGGVIKHG